MTAATPKDTRPTRILHTMLRVGDLERSIAFYVQHLGMSLLRREEYPEGRFTLAFLGYGNEEHQPALELTHNWDTGEYDRGSGYGHVALAVDDLYASCTALERAGVSILLRPGPMRFRSPQRMAAEVIAFVADPDGYPIELIQKPGATGRSEDTST